MKKNIKRIISMLLVIIMTFSIVSCDLGNVENKPNNDNQGNGGNIFDDLEDDDTDDTENNPDGGSSGSSFYTVYLLNRAGWDSVCVYYWNDNGAVDGGWPGVELTEGSNGLYKIQFDREYKSLIFNDNNNGSQTDDLNAPIDYRVVYDNLDNRWLSYAEAMDILNDDNNDDTEGGNDSGNEGGNDSGNEGGNDSGNEGGNDSGNEGGNDSGNEGGNDSGNDSGNEGGNDSGNEGGNDSGNEGGNDSGNNGSTEIITELDLFYALFDYNNHVSLKLDISKSELKKIQKDYEHYSSFGSKSPIYRMADLYVTITTPDGTKYEYVIDQVGVRMKGNTSRTSFYSDNDGMYNLIHFKISFQETFDDEGYYGSDALVWNDSDLRKERKNRTFATLEKIDIRWNKNDDTTYIRESYAYDLYRENGILAPHTTLASVDIRNDHAGVWVIYEPIDKIFLEKNLPAEAIGGDLYKMGWTSEGATFTSFSSYGVEDEDAGKFYVYDLKTNKKTSTHQSLKNLINGLNSSSLTKSKFESLVDLDYFMTFCAVSYFVGSPDDLRNNYNNCYMYFRADTGKMILIPYDLDRGFGITKHWDPYGNGGTGEKPFQTNNVAGDQRSPLFRKTVCDGGMYISEFTQALIAVDGCEMLTDEAFRARFNIAKSLYSSETSTSKNYNNAGGYQLKFDLSCSSNENLSFSDYMKGKRKTLYKYIGDQGNNNQSSGGDSDNNGGSGSDNNDTPTTPDPIGDCDAYIRSDFTNWANDGNYRMKNNGDGIFTITFTRNEDFRFKIYNDRTGAWYGTEVISESCTVDYESDKRTNINLKAGTYTITFDTNTVTINIEKVN